MTFVRARSKLAQRLKHHYERQGKETSWTQYHSTDVNFAFFSRRREVITRLIKRANGRMALDIGCGSGVYSRNLALKGYEVTSLDISKSYVKSTRELTKNYPTHFVIADAQWLPFKDDAFDAVLCSEVLEHLLYPLIAIREIRRVARIGSDIYMSVPSAYSLTEKILRFLGDKEHLHCFSPTFITRLLEEYSMSPTNTRSCNFFIYYFRMLPLAQKLYKTWITLDELLGKTPLIMYLGWCFVIVAKNLKPTS